MPVIRFAGGPIDGQERQILGEPEVHLYTQSAGDSTGWISWGYRRSSATTPEGHRWYLAPGHTRSLIPDVCIAEAAEWLAGVVAEAEHKSEANRWQGSHAEYRHYLAMRYEAEMLRTRGTATPESDLGYQSLVLDMPFTVRIHAGGLRGFAGESTASAFSWPPPDWRSHLPRPGSPLAELLSALAERPDDASLRPVVADALEEAGRDDEAELLRAGGPVIVACGRVNRGLLTGRLTEEHEREHRARRARDRFDVMRYALGPVLPYRASDYIPPGSL